ncbi:hypothetical protein FDX06_03565 [Citrobacter sp. wls618]|jgi:hypothetical protein|nr:hypothetical protein WC7_00807 [Citrobacter sp. KTE151]KAA0559523.1 hypothetical protein F0327_01710 [Citrobacter braakii]PLC62407.1 hypothetical protein B9P82_15310 [Citrobacter sp. L55]TKU02991.1 hypothetical protein FDW91_05245 [Citrobacter sp. wls831]TKU23367.1 hypothetical protein FDW99_22560 [Citrobacter sp. wls758]TKU23914.1 hypothetical protein FDW87_03050 [Citrobacter sp. wls826]TKU88841.1 hypothetical protein FDW90_22620 [Citrobacter sp. wls620]TKV07598.1 hypothetical protein FD
MRKQNKFLHLPLFIALSIVSIFLTSITLYVAGELLFFFFKGIPINFTMENILLLCKISLSVGSFVGGGMWIARLLKLKGF